MNNIIEVFYKNRIEELAVPMAKYMKNIFPFLGIKTPKRKSLSKDFLNSRKDDREVDWEFIDKCFSLPEREFQYLGISYMNRVKNLFTIDDMDRLKGLIKCKSWWDSIDSISPIIGHICLSYPQIMEEVIDKWIFNDNIWVKRVSILFQLKYKEKTDTEFLTKAIVSNSQTSEFFINKAIGWALREYSKTDKVWVRDFINNNELSKLSVREGSKYIRAYFKRFLIGENMRKEAGIEQWNELYEVTINIKKLEPWNYLWDMDIITIILPEYEEPFYCSVMGKGGECYAIAVYRGFEAINGFFKLANTKNMPPNQLIRYQDNLTCYFGDREELSIKELKVIKELGLKFRGRNQWVYYRSFKPNYSPYILDQDEVIELTCVFQHLFMSLKAVIENNLKINFEEGNSLYRIYDKGEDLWLNFEGPMRIPNRQSMTLVIDNELLIEKLKKQKYLKNAVEFDTVFINSVVEDKKYERPIMPKLIVIADKKTGILIEHNMMMPEGDQIKQILDFFVGFIMKSGKPKSIYVRDEYIHDLLSDLCKRINIKIIISEKLLSIDPFAENIFR